MTRQAGGFFTHSGGDSLFPYRQHWLLHLVLFVLLMLTCFNKILKCPLPTLDFYKNPITAKYFHSFNIAFLCSL